jgi:Trk K+ transport system NAD-binding subunit
VVAIQRGAQLIFPEPSTEILAGDVLSALVSKNMEDRLRDVLGSDAASDRDAEDQPMI